MDDQVAAYLGGLLPGFLLPDVLDWLSARTPVQSASTPQAGREVAAMTYFLVPDHDVKLFAGDEKTYRADQVRTIAYGPRFGAAVNGVRMGMTGDDVERLLGPPHRLWPMPHENYVLIYDHPHFFRADLNRRTEQVIAMFR
jgi:hypothetical protein